MTSMQKRQALLSEYIQKKGEVRFAELCDLYPDVSSMTIRRDLEKLEQEGSIQRFRGGARSMDIQTQLKEATYDLREAERTESKRRIADKAADFLSESRSIYIDAGTTCVQLAKLVPDENIFVLTPAPYVALELVQNRVNVKVHLIGGQLNRDTLALSGSYSKSYVRNLNIDLAFIGASACSLKNGFSCGDYLEAELKKTIINKAQKVICMMDVSKLNSNMPYTFARPRDIDVLVTDHPLPESYRKMMQRSNTVCL